jgi:hypothetical protein
MYLGKPSRPHQLITEIVFIERCTMLPDGTRHGSA